MMRSEAELKLIKNPGRPSGTLRVPNSDVAFTRRGVETTRPKGGAVIRLAARTTLRMTREDDLA